MTEGSQWVMRSIYTSDPVTFSAKRVRQLGPRTVLDLHQSFPWANYSLLISNSTNGVLLEGFSYQGGTYWLPEPEPFLRTDVAVAKSWNTSVGPVSLLAKNISVTVGTGVYSGAYVFAIGGAPEKWTVVPGVGIIKYSVNGVDFGLATVPSLSAASLSTPFVSKPCPTPGLTVIPESAALTDQDRQSALNLSTAIGSGNLIVGASWAELEPAQGTYRLDRIKSELQLAAKRNLPTVFNLRIPQATTKAVPSYLSGLALNDSKLLSRLNALMTQLGPLLPAQVRWVNIGYEVDTYLFFNRADLASFLTMYDSASKTLRSVKPGVSVGMVFSFDTSRSNDTMFQALVSRADHVTFTYYGLYGDYIQRRPDSPLFDIPLMLSMTASKPLIISELGYSSGLTGEAAQAEFFRNALQALAKTGGKVAAYSVWSYRDIPASDASTVANAFALSSSNFIPFITSTGMVDSAGRQKPAWNQLLGNFPVFTSGACTGPGN